MEQRGGPPQDPQAQYADVRRRIHRLVGCLIEPGSTVVVVSKGDQELVELGANQGWHFPRTGEGKYAGHHPADGAEAIAHLEQLRQQGAHYFLLPSTYTWWLDHYEGFARHLRSRYRMVADCPDTCLIYDLRRDSAAIAPVVAAPRAASAASAASGNGGRAESPLVPGIRALLDSLLPAREPVLVVSDGDDDLLRLGRTALHFPHDAGGAHRSSDSMRPGGIAAQLTGHRARGLRYVVVPDTARDRVGPSGALREPLREQGRKLALREGICAIYELEDAEPAPKESAAGNEPSAGSLRRLLSRARGRADD
jgi:hypothetical protein